MFTYLEAAMKYPFLILLALALLTTALSMMLTSAVLAELKQVFNRKRDPELEAAD